MTRQPTRAAAALAGVALALAVLHAGAGRLPGPPLFEPSRLPAWFAHHDAAEATFALLRIAGLGTGWYLLAATALQILARTLRSRSLLRTANALSLPAVRRLGAGMVGLTLSASSAGAADLPSAPTAVMHHVVDPAGATLQRLPEAGRAMVRLPRSGPTASLTRLDEGTSDDEAVLRRLPDAPAPEVEPRPTPAAPAGSPTDTWTVTCGDHLWSIAAETLADHRGAPVSDDDVEPYWRQLLSANDLADPDLLFPGQTIVLPPVAGS